MDCVIGSGPAGVACASALLKRGRAVHMLDAGLRLEPDRAEIVQRLAQSPPEAWSAQDRQWLTSGMNPGATGIPSKLLFGSDYPYRDAERELRASYGEVGLRASLAFGGLSTVWGAAMLPSLQSDIADWPITVEQLAPHYRSAAKLVPLSAERDELGELLPLFAESPGHLEASRQAQVLWRALQRNRDKLRAANIHFGRARVAIQAARADQPGCVYCGMCLYGCPYGFIYNSASTVAQLQRSTNFTCQTDVVVETVEESANGVRIRGHDRVTRQSIGLNAARVFLAAGVIPTTGILLRSFAARDRTIRMKDTAYFLLPLALMKRVARVRDERLHALSQIFLEVLDPDISPHAVHLQIYSYNDLMGKAVRKSLGPLASPLGFFAREAENRLLLVQGFIHSAHSSEIAVTLRRDRAVGVDRIQLEPVINPEAEKVIRRVVRKISKHSLKLGAVPLAPMLQIAPPGRSFHSGGTFPMRGKPGDFETDIWGRPVAWKRVHAVDATVLPSIPGTTITFTVMANAHRIASASPELE